MIRSCAMLSIAMALLLVSVGRAETAASQGAPAAATQADPDYSVWKRITVTVREKASSRPLANARVTISRCYERKLKFTTNADGVADIPLPPRAKDGYAIDVALDGFVPLTLSSRPKENDDSFNFDLEPATTISGRVLDDADQPLADATVTIHVVVKQADRKMPRPDLVYVDTRTDASGKWTFNTIPEKFDEINLGAFHPMCLPGSYGFFTMNAFKDVAALRSGSAVIKLNRGTPVHIVVNGPDGKPLANAMIGTGSDRVASNALPAFPTNDKGEVTLGIVAGSDLPVTVMATHCAPELRTISVPTKPMEVVFNLKAAFTLAGRIVDGDGNPVGGATIYIDTWRGTRTLDTRLTSNDKGEFTWKQAPEDAVFVDVFKQGYADKRKIAMTQGQENKIVLLSPTKVHATVVDAVTNKPIEKFQVVTGIDFKDGRIYWQRGQSDPTARMQGTNGAWETTFSYPYPAYVIRIEADGYLPADSAPVELDGKLHELAFSLKAGEAIRATITADGKPVENATAFLVTGGYPLMVVNGAVPDHYRRETVSRTSDKSGAVSFPPTAEKFLLVVLTDAGFAKVTNEDLLKSNTITLNPWAKVEGVVKVGTKLAAKGRVSTWLMSESPNDQKEPSLHLQYQADIDSQGHYSLERLLPGEYSIGREVQLANNATSMVSSVRVSVEAGKTITTNIGGVGRPVIAHFTVPASLGQTQWVPGWASIQSDIKLPSLPYPDGFASLSADEKKAWYTSFKASEEGKKFDAEHQRLQKQIKHTSAAVNAELLLRAEEVTEGKYRLSFTLNEAPKDRTCGFGEPLATATKEFTVGPIEGGVTDEPLDLGEIAMTEVVTLRVGQAAPNFTVKTLDNKEIKLEDYKGKYVLLDFWATWCGPCVAETPHLKAAWEAFGKNDKFAMIGLSLDQESKAPIDYVKKQDLSWTQGFLGEWSKSDLPNKYGVNGIPSIWLIGPDGKVLAKGLRGEQIKATLAEYLR